MDSTVGQDATSAFTPTVMDRVSWATSVPRITAATPDSSSGILDARN